MWLVCSKWLKCQIVQMDSWISGGPKDNRLQIVWMRSQGYTVPSIPQGQKKTNDHDNESIRYETDFNNVLVVHMILF